MKLTHWVQALSVGLCLSYSASALAQSSDQESSKQAKNQSDQQQQIQNKKQQEKDKEQEKDKQQEKQKQKQKQNDKAKQADTPAESRQRAGQRSPQSGSKNASASQFRLEPQGWVRIATDYDQDGRFDAYETIYYYDLEEARTKSQKRSQQKQPSESGQSNRDSQRTAERKTSSRQQRERSQQMARERNQRSSSGDRSRDASSQANESRQMARRMARTGGIRGEIIALTKMETPNSSHQKTVAQVRSETGKKALVCLGPADKVSQLQLEKGDRIQAEGVVASVHDTPILIAASVSANGESIKHKLTRRAGISRQDGRLVSLRETSSRRDNSTYLVGEVKTDEGTRKIHFGPKNQLAELNLSEGDQVSVVTRQGQVSGKSALIAMQVKANDRSVNVTRTSTGSTDSESRNDQRGSRSSSSGS